MTSLFFCIFSQEEEGPRRGNASKDYASERVCGDEIWMWTDVTGSSGSVSKKL